MINNFCVRIVKKIAAGKKRQEAGKKLLFLREPACAEKASADKGIIFA
jgi:hypothetical protein